MKMPQVNIIVKTPQIPLKKRLAAIRDSLISWSWAKRVLYWIVMSAGTAGELILLVASVWISLNAYKGVHEYLVNLIGQGLDTTFTANANIAYIALPEVIVSLAVVTVINHVRMGLYKPRENWISFVWAGLFALPAIMFLSISMCTLYGSVTSGSFSFALPDWLAGWRALGAYWFAFCGLLYVYVGKPHEAQKLKARDSSIRALQKNNIAAFFDGLAEFTSLQEQKARELSDLRTEKDKALAKIQADYEQAVQVINELQGQLNMQASRVNKLEHLMNKSSDEALQAYGEECVQWLNNGSKSFKIEEITRYTGHSWQRINGALATGKLRKPPKGKGLVTRDSLIEFLKTTPPIHVVKEQDIDATEAM